MPSLSFCTAPFGTSTVSFALAVIISKSTVYPGLKSPSTFSIEASIATPVLFPEVLAIGSINVIFPLYTLSGIPSEVIVTAWPNLIFEASNSDTVAETINLFISVTFKRAVCSLNP